MSIVKQLVDEIGEMTVSKWKNIETEPPNKDKILVVIDQDHEYLITVYFDKYMAKWTDNRSIVRFKWYFDLDFKKLPDDFEWRIKDKYKENEIYHIIPKN